MQLKNVVPLSSGYMLTSIVGYLVSAVYVYPSSQKWGMTLILFFGLMFAASLISMTYAPERDHLHIVNHKEKRL